jgi:hypothetical protein
MSVTPRNIIPAQYASATPQAEYLAELVTLIDQFTVTNTSVALASITLNTVPALGTASAANRIVSARQIAPGETFIASEMVGHVLEIGASIWCGASTGSALVICASGRLVA